VATLISISPFTAASDTSGKSASNSAADLILVNGEIVTLDNNNPEAEAVAVKDGHIVAVGNRAEVMKLRSPATKLVNLEGSTVVPGFIDAHGHITTVAQTASYVNLAAPPVGRVSSFQDLARQIHTYIRERNVAAGQWVVGFGYEPAFLKEKRHPTRKDLDKISMENPILLMHQSGHLGTANSRALAEAGINRHTPNPEGGAFLRDPNSDEPNGVMEETALWQVFGALPQTGMEDALQSLEKAQAIYASYGITTAQDGRSSPHALALLKTAATEKRLQIDVIAYPDIEFASSLKGDFPVGRYKSHLKLGGVKINLDGSPQAKTAWLTQPYHIPPHGKPASYHGYPAYSDEKVNGFFKQAHENGWQMLVHCNGDAASDQMIKAIRELKPRAADHDWRPVMIHAQMVREDQLDEMKSLGIIPSFFSAHMFFYGDWHRDSVMGAERAYRINPAKSALKRDMIFTIHNDPPVVPPDIMRLIWSAVNRRSRTNDIIGPEQTISPLEALKAVTLYAAYQAFEETSKGSIEVGKRADFAILSANPLTADPMMIKDIEVLKTVKDGKVIFELNSHNR
jgi:predicted amidohydrolase YtcJ